MNKDLQERLSALEEQNLKLSNEIAAIKKELEAPEKKERWRADSGEKYHCISMAGYIDLDMEYFTDMDKVRHESFNYFQTQEEAERIDRVQLAYRKLDWAIRQFELEDGLDHNGIEFFINVNGEVIYRILTGSQTPFPKLKLNKDAEYILSNYKAELLTFLTGGEK